MIPGNANPLLLASAAAADGAAAGVATKSLRFNDGDSAYLNRTPSSAGNRRTWTWAAWVKRSTFSSSSEFALFGMEDDVILAFAQDKLKANVVAGANALTTSQVFRDPSAWYHLVFAIDTTNGTPDNRVRIYVNGSEITDFSSRSNPSQNADTNFNKTSVHYIGRQRSADPRYFDGYLADIYFIDGSQLDPTSFGAYDDNGVWQASGYSGTYGTNGFHLDFADSSDLGDDNSGNGNDFTPNNLSGTGAATSSAAVLNLPLNSTPFSDSSASSATVTNTGSVSTASAGTNSFNITNAASLNGSSQRLTTNNNNISFQGSWTVDVYFKIDSGASDGQGLFNSGYGSQTSHYMYIAIDSSDRPFIETSSSGSRSTASAISKNVWYHMRVIQKSGTITMYINGTSVVTHTAQTTDLSTAGSRTIGSLLDNANNQNNFDGLVGPFRIINDALDAPSSGGEATSSGTLANTGTKTVGADIDSLFDVPTNGDQSDTGVGGEVSGNYATLNPLNTHNSDNTLVDGNLEFTSTGNNAGICESTIAMSSGKFYFEVVFSGGQGNQQFAGIRKPGARNYDDSFIYVGTGNKYTNGGSGASYGASLSNGDIIGTAFDADNGTLTFYKNGTSQGQAFSGISGAYSFVAGSFGSTPAYIVNFGQRPFAYAAPSGFKALNTANLSTPTIADGRDYFETAIWDGDSASSRTIATGFGPDFVWIKNRGVAGRSHYFYDAVRGFGANKELVPNQTNEEGSTGHSTDVAGYVSGTTSSGFTLAAGSSNSNYTNQSGQTYVGWAWDGGDLVTNSAYNQSQTWSSATLSNGSNLAGLFDGSLSTNAQQTTNGTAASITNFGPITVSSTVSFYSPDGDARYTLNGGSEVSVSGTGWHDISFSGSLTSFTFQAPGNARIFIYGMKVDNKQLIDPGIIPIDSVSSGVPSIQSTVRATQTAGFSIVSYGNASDGDTIGHGLSASPHLIITKNRDISSDWNVYFDGFGASDVLNLNNTDAKSTSGSNTFIKAVSSTTFTVGSSSLVSGSNNFIAYCISPVAGYSAVGSYSGNGSSDGPLVHLNFKPAWIIIKNSSAGENWYIIDTTRDEFNVSGTQLKANTNDAEDSFSLLDLLSNGFKIRNSNASYNTNGSTYLYAAFAENPIQANGGLAR